MSSAIVVPIVAAILGAFSATGLAALFLVPKQKAQMDANATYTLTQSVVLANQEVDRLREKVAALSAQLDNSEALRRAAEQQLEAWHRRFPPPPPPPIEELL